jgi:hypothetical protein
MSALSLYGTDEKSRGKRRHPSKNILSAAAGSPRMTLVTLPVWVTCTARHPFRRQDPNNLPTSP